MITWGPNMNLGEKIKQERLALGLSQRQLCGEQITRNMLSQIEGGTARPSMDTLRFLAGRLGKPMSYFLEESAVTSPNLALMCQAREAYGQKAWEQVLTLLEQYREPDGVFQWERWLLEAMAALELGQQAMADGRRIYCATLLLRAKEAIDKTPYGSVLLGDRLREMNAKLNPQTAELPSLDEALILRAQVALAAGKEERAAALLYAVEAQDGPKWNYFMAEVFFAGENFREAVAHYHRAENEMPDAVIPRLELCYRELEDFKMAYEYACKRR